MSRMCRVEAIEFLMRHAAKPWMGLQRIGVLLELADTCFKAPHFRSVI